MMNYGRGQSPSSDHFRRLPVQEHGHKREKPISTRSVLLSLAYWQHKVMLYLVMSGSQMGLFELGISAASLERM